MVAQSPFRFIERITCPHCWQLFPCEDSLWIAEHPDLIGDSKLGEYYPQRFLPSRFTAEGDAIDPEGQRCNRLACPNCHLEIPRPLYQIAPLFFSILGAPACGKSYFLSSMTWKLRQVLPRKFQVSMNDASADANTRLHEYEEVQFMNPDMDTPVALAKTETQGDMYDIVDMGDHTITLPRPFMFTLQPMASHPNHSRVEGFSKVVCMYDNAGESFLPGADTTVSPVTRHLALSQCLFFCFDPTQDPRFRRACQGKTADPQMEQRSTRLARENSVRQDTILLEAIQRVRRHAGLREDKLHQRPLVIVVTKWDAWEQLLPTVTRDLPYQKATGHHLCGLDVAKLMEVSKALRRLLEELCPEVVAAGEGFAKELIFIPVSATGHAPTRDPDTGNLGIRPRDISPYWVEVPMIYALNRFAKGLVGTRDF